MMELFASCVLMIIMSEILFWKHCITPKHDLCVTVETQATKIQMAPL
jgi:hypothetical protein